MTNYRNERELEMKKVSYRSAGMQESECGEVRDEKSALFVWKNVGKMNNLYGVKFSPRL